MLQVLMKLQLVFLLVMVSISGNAQNSLQTLLEKYNTHSVPYISVEELRMLQVDDSVLVLDARELEEYQVSHIKNAVFVGSREFSLETIPQKLKTSKKPIVVYCSLGIRSEKIGEKLQKAGYKKVRNLYGGIFEWKNEGFEVFADGKATDSVHAYNEVWGKWLKKGKKVY